MIRLLVNGIKYRLKRLLEMTIPERIKLPKLDNDDVDKVCLDSYGIVYHHLEPSEV